MLPSQERGVQSAPLAVGRPTSWRRYPRLVLEIIAFDEFLTGVAAKYAACGWAVVQMDHDGGLEPWFGVGGNMPMSLDVQRAVERAENWWLYIAWTKLVGPAEIYSDDGGVVQALNRSDFTSGDQLAQEPSIFECSFASGFDVDANSTMEKSCAGRRSLVAKTCSTVPCSRHLSIVAGRAGLVATSFLSNRSNRVHTFARNSWFIESTSGLQWTCATKNVGDVAPS